MNRELPGWKMNYLKFNSGLELASLLVSSDLLHHSWAIIQNLYEVNRNEPKSLRYQIYKPDNITFVAFVTLPTCSWNDLQDVTLLCSPTQEIFSLFRFLSSSKNPSFSFQNAAANLFASFHYELSQLKSMVHNTWPLVITGYSLGGSVASLFTLWLLEIIKGPTSKHPLCISFGAPLICDPGVQAGLENSKWNSCFLHVAAREDPVLKLFISPDYPHIIDSALPNRSYKPFGTFLLCSEFGCTWLEEPQSVLEFLVAMGLESAGIQILEDDNLMLHYGNILERLGSMLILQGSSRLDEQSGRSLQAGLVLKLEAIGIKTPQPQQVIDPNALVTRMEKLEKASIFDPSKKLNKMKIYMAELEWYKKDCKDRQIGYYDSYKNMGSRSDIKVATSKRMLTNYWKEMVAEANKKPQKEGASFRTRWLYAGTNYRRMIEPLEIAEYYKEKGQEDYIRNGRSKHFVQLEEWLKEAEKPSGSSNKSTKQNLANLLTFDSCFWARVEEALIACKMWMGEGCTTNDNILLRDKLIEFEQYTMELIENHAVSPEIFLEHSSFMQWWRQYEKITGTSYHSQFTSFMKNCYYRHYDKND